MKRGKCLYLALVLALVSVLVIAGCAKPAPPPAPPTPAPTPAPAPAPAPAPPKPAPPAPPKFEKVELTLAHVGPPGSLYWDISNEFDRLLKKYTDDQVSLKVFGFGELFKSYVKGHRQVMDGLIDMDICPDPGFVANGLPDWQILTIPGLLGADPSIESYSGERMDYLWSDPEAGGILKAQLKDTNVHYLWYYPMWPGGVSVKGEYGLAEIKGLKFRCPPSKGDLSVIEALGGTPITMASGEVYMGLKSGMIDGAITSFGTYVEKAWPEVCPYWIDWDLIRHTMYITINLDKWNSLSPELRKLIEETVSPEVEQWAKQAIINDVANKTSILKEKFLGDKYMLSGEDKATVEERLAPTYARWREIVNPKLVDAAIRASKLGK